MGIILQKAAGAVLFALILVVGLNLVGNGLIPVGPPKHVPAKIAASEGGVSEQAAQAGGTTAQATPGTAAPEKPLDARLAAANAQTGQATAKVCTSCHNFAEGAGAKVGPDLYGVVGRPKASASGFAYSDGLKKLGGNWSYEDLDRFLSKPSGFAPGTKMTFAGLPDGDKRADVIAYLKSISPNAPALPQAGQHPEQQPAKTP